MGVLMQAFYWDCPRNENCEFAWWPRVEPELAALRQAGITALWLPPATKAGGAVSMGYDPYDYYDLGEFDQKGGRATWFGTRDQLDSLVSKAHAQGMSLYADLVLNHNNGADEMELNPLTGKQWWYRFKPLSGRFERDWACFHPSSFETFDEMEFAGMPDLCHRNPAVYAALVDHAHWLVEEIGFDGFRFDFVKGFNAWIIRAILEYRYSKPGRPFLYKPFGVGENWDSEQAIERWLDTESEMSDNPVSAFDFPLRYTLQGLCDSPDFDLRRLNGAGLAARRPARAVTFVDNHDLLRLNDPDHTGIIHDKMMAYAYILTHEGYPCVFWMDWFNFGLARPGQPTGIAALSSLHEQFAGGSSRVLYASSDLYIMQRSGFGAQPGLVIVINNRRDRWTGTAVTTRWPNITLTPQAWCSAIDTGTPSPKRTDADGRADLWAPPRGYAVYVPQ
ncbi:MAG: DUF1939 domain-containing protein [Bryobacterales bacterium]|nr:DUF1939 domain-containing protein [Bryobacterales bacterium]